MKRAPRPHFENPSAKPHTLLTVSGICVLNLIITGGSVDFVLSVVADAKFTVGREIIAGSNDEIEQSQLDRMLKPAIARVMLAPGLLTMTVMPYRLQESS